MHTNRMTNHTTWHLRPLTLAVLLAVNGGVRANPQGGEVVAGSAQILHTTPTELTITQASDRAVINWQEFSIGAGESTRFVQPSAASVVLNRVTGGNPSAILGQLSANGNLFIVNRNGVVFGADARVDVHGLVATTSDIDDAAFMAGDYRFTTPGRADAAIVNLGQISIADAGLAAFVAPAVRNDGVIVAHLGRVALGAGNGFALDLYGDRLIQLAVDPITLAALNPDGTAVSALIANGGSILAEGGDVLLTANSARDVVDHVINVSGIVSAGSARVEGGTIVLEAGDGTAHVSGTLDASGTAGGQVRVSGDTVFVSDAQIAALGAEGAGGTIHLLGNRVGVVGDTLIDGSGATGGGTVLIGGDYQGANAAVRNASYTVLGSSARIKADALRAGDGGKVILWSNDITRLLGSISARGGAQGGDGGFVETSGKGFLDFRGSVDTSAANGRRGTLLLDPTNITVGANADINGNAVPGDDITSAADLDNAALDQPGATSLITAAQVASLLNSTDLTLAATNNIFITSAIAKTGATATSLTLSANRINISADITSTNSALNLTLNSGSGVGAGTFLQDATLGLHGGTLAGSRLTIGGSGNSKLDDVALNTDVGVSGVGLHLSHGITFMNNHVIEIDSNDGGAGSLFYDDTLTIGGTGRIAILDSNFYPVTISCNGSALAGGCVTAPGTTLTIGSGITLSNTNVSESSYLGRYAGDNIISAATIDIGAGAGLNINGTFTLAGGAITGAGGAGVNGALNVTGNTAINSATFATAGTTTINDSAAGTSYLDLSGIWNNVGTLIVDGDDGLRLRSGGQLINTGTVDLRTGAATAIDFTGTGTGAIDSSGLFTVSAAGSHAIASPIAFTLSGGSLTGAGDLIVNGAFNIAEVATLTGSGSLITRGTSTVDLATTGGLVTLSEKNWVNEGSLTLGGDDSVAFDGNGASSLTNAAGAMLTLASSAATPFELLLGSATITNAGTVTANAPGAHTINSGIVFNNSGTLRVTAGQLSVGAGVSPGAFAIGAGAELDFTGAQQFGAPASFTGAGDVAFVAGGSTFTSAVSTVVGRPVAITADAGPLVLGAIGAPTNGTAIDNGNGTFTYTPTTTFTGVDTVAYTVGGSAGGSAAATTAITVTRRGLLPHLVEDPEPVVLASADPDRLPRSGSDARIFIGRVPGAKPARGDYDQPLRGWSDGSAPAAAAGESLLDRIARLAGKRYTPEDRARFLATLTAQEVVAALRAGGYGALAAIMGEAAETGGARAADFHTTLGASGLPENQQLLWLGVFDQMRHLGMTSRLAGAIDLLRDDPAAADEVDEGTAGGPIRLTAPKTVASADGLVNIAGHVHSASKLVQLRVNGRWTHVDEHGDFAVQTSLPAGDHHFTFDANDPAGMRAATQVKVVSKRDGPALPKEGRHIALLVGVEEYDNAIPELETPVADARALDDTLRAGYGFETRLLRNPTKRDVLDALRALSAEVTAQDSVVVFYAGHGYLMSETGRGYWLPRDAETNNPRNWVSNRDVARLFLRTRAKQILMISDSCYSGAFTKEGIGAKLVKGNAHDQRAVMAFSSGGEQPVWDSGGDGHSIFASRLMATLNNSRAESGGELYNAVYAAVTRASPQVPGYGAMVSAGYDPGADFALK